MAKNDRKHFERYREQTRVKHVILEKYLPAYYRILKRTNKHLNYIDGFAGPGVYLDGDHEVPGSPLRALSVLAENADLAGVVSCTFIEFDEELAKQLSKRVRKFFKANPKLRKPHVECGKFAEVMSEGLDDLEQDDKSIAPTFLLVDPCGVDGVDFNVIERFVEAQSCEVFLFFNLDAIRRIAGLGEGARGTLAQLLGSENRKKELVDRVEKAGPGLAKEQAILAYYVDLLKEELGLRYVLPFCVEYETRATTSHYLIHATKHRLGFKIMKEVMWPLGKGGGGTGGFSLLQKSRRRASGFIFSRDEEIKKHILSELGRFDSVRVSHFYETLACQSDNYYCAPAYRPALLSLESEGKLIVLDKDGQEAVPAEVRPKRKGEPTLGPDYFLTLGDD